VADEEKKKFDASNLIPIIPVGFMVLIIGGIVWESLGAHVYGTMPAQIETLSLEGSPRQVAKGLTLTDVHSSSVRAKFKTSAGKPYEYFELSWDSRSANPTSLRLVPESEKSEEDRGDDVVAALARRFHALHDGDWQWGRVDIKAHKRDGELEARVATEWNKKPNSLFDRQMDAARQILLEVAFGIPVHASDAELAELLGAGYKTADVGKIDPETPIENVPALMTARFPGALHDSSNTWEIAIDQPLFKSVAFTWENRSGGTLADTRLAVDDAYAPSRDTLQACLASTLGAPHVKITDYAAGKKDYVFAVGALTVVLGRTDVSISAPWRGSDGASLAKLFDALAGCREKSENTGARGDGRKK
jgi:hypothetical protein